MLYKILDKQDFKDFVSSLISGYELIGPKKINKTNHDFVPIQDFGEIDLAYKKTTLPPAKKILFPSYESLVTYKVTPDIEIKPLNESSEKILFGVSPWDINGINFLDRLFSTDFVDQNYIEKRNKIIIIGYDAEPTEANFALQMGAEYASDGFDLFLTDIGDKYFIRVGTSRGNAIIGNYSQSKDAGQDDFKKYDAFLNTYKKKFNVKVNLQNFNDNFEVIYDNSKLWDKFSKNCFSCGSCNLVCPTCFCFNVRDDMEINLKEGNKTREWDSCMIPEYGLVAGEHNFRPDNSNRLKQRYRCKLKTFVGKFGTNSCVGCGRCVEACLAKINIYEDINSIKEEVSI